jgi:hypothetical protein
MDKAEIQTRRNGTGYLVLRSGVSKQVTWEIEVLNDGSGGKGIVRGDKDHLAAAAKDGCANLLASADTTVAVAIDGCENGEASFSLLLVSSAPRTFRAETIENSGPIVDGNRFLIEFSGSDDERLFVILPTIIMRDYLITLEKVVPPSSISLIRSPKSWAMAIGETIPFVCLIFDGEPPLALQPNEARMLAAELVESAKVIEDRPTNLH